MKLITLFLTFAFSASLSSQTVKTIKPKPSKATVYLSGAEITYSESLYLVAGTYEIIIEGVSPYVDENTISAYFKGGLVIDTKKAQRYPELPKNPLMEDKYARFVLRISDSLEELSYLIKDAKNKQMTFQKERTLLLNSRLMRGEFSKDSLALLKSTLDLLRSRLTNIDEEELLMERKLNKHYKLQTNLTGRKEYYELLQREGAPIINPDLYNPVYQVIVAIETEQAVTGNLSLKYYVANAGWLPVYDIQASSGKDKIQLIYRAQVYQNSGLDWKDIALILSTSNPAVGNTKPVLTEWNLIFGYPNSYLDGLNKQKSLPANNYNNLGSRNMKREDLSLSDKEIIDEKPEPLVPLFSINNNFLRTEYEIKTRYTIAGDNKAHNVIINNVEISVALAYLSVPKLDKDAFLMGKVANWEDLNLMPGAAKIYFDESYIGTTAINPVSTSDTLYVNLGRDKSIITKRQNVKEKCREQNIGEYKIVSKTIEITIRNTKGIALDFEIEDQIPITTDPNIKITLGDNDHASYNEVTGKLTWKMNIKPKDTKKLRFTYEVKYPKDKFIAGL